MEGRNHHGWHEVMKIALAGGSGYLGSHIRCSLERFKGVSIHNISLRTRSEAENGSSKGLAFYDQIEGRKELVNVDTVIFAASVNAAGCNVDPVFAKEIGCNRKAKTVEMLGSLGLKRVVNLSSIHVYGKKVGEVISEKVSPSPESAYGRIHYECENLLEEITSGEMLEFANFRLSNVYGFMLKNKESPAWDLVANDFARQLAMHKRVQVRMPKEVRNFVPLSRVVNLTTKVAMNGLSSKNYKTLNLSSSCSLALSSLRAYLERVSAGEEKRTIIRDYTCVEPRYDYSRSLLELGMQCNTETEEVESEFEQLVRIADKLWKG